MIESAEGRPAVGTIDFKADIAAELRRFTKLKPNSIPVVLKVTPVDAMIWHSAAGTRESTAKFLTNTVVPYLATVPCNGRKLKGCRIEQLPDEGGDQTHFE